MTQKVVYADSFEPLFKKSGFTKLEDFFNTEPALKSAKTQKRFVEPLVLKEGTQAKSFFVKRFYYSHFADVLSSIANFGCVISQAECEWRNAKLLLSKGFKAYKPICYGEQKIFAFEKRSFFISEALESAPLSDFVANNWPVFPMAQKEDIIRSLGETVRKVHDVGISMPDLYIWHVFIEPKESGGYEFTFIDLHRMRPNVKKAAEKIKNLGRLDFSLRRQYFTRPLRELLIHSYAGSDWPGGVCRLVKTVEAYSMKLSARRKPKPY